MASRLMAMSLEGEVVGDLPVERGVAPIKAEYRVTFRPEPSLSLRERENNAHSNETKVINRNKANRKILAGTKTRACPAIVQGKPCGRGQLCKLEHDLQPLLDTKGEDLPGQCPNILAGKPFCKFGLLCRFGSSHPPVDKLPLEKDKSGDDMLDLHHNNETDGATNEPVLNLGNLIHQLRKGQVSFPCSQKSLARKDTIDGFDFVKVQESGQVNFQNQLYLAPLTTVGNLPFRRLCREFGADITCGEMAMATNLIRGQVSELALLRRHHTETPFGVQICGGWTDSMTQAGELLTMLANQAPDDFSFDFVDVNMGCPIDLVFRKGMGSGLLDKPTRIRQILTGLRTVLPPSVPLTVKMRLGIEDGKPLINRLLPILYECGVQAVTIHGRSRQQRYTRAADWSYISSLVDSGMTLIGNGDIFSYEDYEHARSLGFSSVMIGRGALIKPWLFTELRERRHWDISASERLDILAKYSQYGLEHFGSDKAGVERTRMFMLEWLSFLCRYVPIGLLEILPPRINDRPPAFHGRSELETLMASSQSRDWIKLTELFLGPVPENYNFVPKHKSNSYEHG